jgi:hypothetical protein
MKKVKKKSLFCDYEVADISAVQALVRGDATPEQQKRALNWVIYNAAMTYEHPFCDDDRESNHLIGRQFVGRQIVKLTKLDVQAFIKATNKKEKHD